MILPQTNLFNQSDLLIAFGTKQDGLFGRRSSAIDKAEKNNRLDFYQQLGIDSARVIEMMPNHFSRVKIISGMDDSIGNFDALATDIENLYFSLATADCVPLVLYESTKRIVVLAHIGWRGVVFGLPQKIVKKIIKEFILDPKSIRVYLGPSVEMACYRQKGFKGIIKALLFFLSGNRLAFNYYRSAFRFDLNAGIINQLTIRGLKIENMEINGGCTVCQTTIFPSNFREKKTRKTSLITVVGLKNKSFL
ncbi:MAG: polyphenol oxidase family protein [Candidatus Buchananbacteria bacterium]|nr:polyphenol oxidase family protein [Candidatus Buchananbacteria bacterium]